MDLNAEPCAAQFPTLAGSAPAKGRKSTKDLAAGDTSYMMITAIVASIHSATEPSTSTRPIFIMSS
jgi:hypothetical protein